MLGHLVLSTSLLSKSPVFFFHEARELVLRDIARTMVAREQVGRLKMGIENTVLAPQHRAAYKEMKLCNVKRDNDRGTIFLHQFIAKLGLEGSEHLNSRMVMSAMYRYAPGDPLTWEAVWTFTDPNYFLTLRDCFDFHEQIKGVASKVFNDPYVCALGADVVQRVIGEKRWLEEQAQNQWTHTRSWNHRQKKYIEKWNKTHGAKLYMIWVLRNVCEGGHLFSLDPKKQIPKTTEFLAKMDDIRQKKVNCQEFMRWAGEFFYNKKPTSDGFHAFQIALDFPTLYPPDDFDTIMFGPGTKKTVGLLFGRECINKDGEIVIGEDSLRQIRTRLVEIIKGDRVMSTVWKDPKSVLDYATLEHWFCEYRKILCHAISRSEMKKDFDGKCGRKYVPFVPRHR